MAKASERDRYKYGICTNRDKDGKPCPKCESKEVQKIRMGQDFVCEECKETMRQVPPPKPPTPWGKIIGIIVAALIILGGGAVFIFSEKGIKIESIVLDKENLVLHINETYTLKATISPTEAKKENLRWSSKDNAVATVENGVVKAVGLGEAIISLIDIEDNIEALCMVKVTKIDSIILDSENLVMHIDETYTLKATIFPTEAKKENLKWSSKNTTVATVENGIVKAVGLGEATISLKDTEGNVEALCMVKVTKVTKVTEGTEGTGGNGGNVGTIDYSYGKYTGDVKDGKPHGNGTIEYTKSHKIINDKDYVASPGDKVTGSFRDGRINVATWYQRDGKSLVIK
jgi:uncharacterized protein YjdB